MSETELTETTVSPDAVAERISAGDAQVVDVRTHEEHEAGHIAGALHIPVDELHARAPELDKDTPVVAYCRGGDRSASAADALRASGWQAYSMEGGLLAWAEAGQPLEPQGGQVAEGTNLPPR